MLIKQNTSDVLVVARLLWASCILPLPIYQESPELVEKRDPFHANGGLIC